jgi:hypothetical protein
LDKGICLFSDTGSSSVQTGRNIRISALKGFL